MTTPAVSRPRAVARGELPQAAFRLEQRVRFPHCDPAGMVYTGRYVDLINVTLECFYEHVGLDYYALIGPRRIGLGYARFHMDFHRPAFMGDVLSFTVLVNRVGGGSLGFDIHGHRGDAPVLQADVVSATTDLVGHASIPLPPDVRAAAAAYQELCR